MDEKQADLILRALEYASSNPDAAVEAARLTVWGMIGVALISLAAQLFTTRLLFHKERRRQISQIDSDIKSKALFQWKESVQENVSELLAATDPEISAATEKQQVVRSTLKIQLELDESIAEQAALNRAINKLSLAVNGWEQKTSKDIFGLQNEVLQATKDAVRSELARR